MQHACQKTPSWKLSKGLNCLDTKKALHNKFYLHLLVISLTDAMIIDFKSYFLSTKLKVRITLELVESTKIYDLVES